MPYSIRKSGKYYKVINSITGRIHAQHSTLPKAKAQIRIMEYFNNNKRIKKY